MWYVQVVAVFILVLVIGRMRRDVLTYGERDLCEWGERHARRDRKLAIVDTERNLVDATSIPTIRVHKRVNTAPTEYIAYGILTIHRLSQ